MRISIIIPVYNVEKYISRCLDSILSIKSIDWECILIDDGSTDCSWDIVCRYAKISDQFIIKQKKNGGVSSARNMGLEISSGDWVMFVDPDDFLFPEVNQVLSKAVTDYKNYDMILLRWVYMLPNGKKKEVEAPKVNFNDDVDWIRKTVLVGYTMSNCWAKLFKNSFIKKNNLRFDSTMRIAEDTCFVLDYLLYARTIMVLNDSVVYAYCQNADSALTRFRKEDMDDLFKKYEKIYKLADKRNVFIPESEEKKANNFFFNSICAYIFRCAKNYSRKQFNIIIKEVLNEQKISKIIHRCNVTSDTLEQKISKFLIRNKLLNTCWFLVRIKNRIKTIL